MNKRCDCCGSARWVKSRALVIEPFPRRQLTSWHCLCAGCWKMLPTILPELEGQVRRLVLAAMIPGGVS
jgi:hypothetical protein